MPAQHSIAIIDSKQVGGDHYSSSAILCPHCGGELQHWDIFARHPHLVAAATKYLMRYEHKGGLEDLYKARSYTQKLIEVTILEMKRKGLEVPVETKPQSIAEIRDELSVGIMEVAAKIDLYGAIPKSSGDCVPQEKPHGVYRAEGICVDGDATESRKRADAYAKSQNA